MIEFGATLLLVALAVAVFALIDAARVLLASIADYRDAQATSMLHHAGLLEADTED